MTAACRDVSALSQSSLLPRITTQGERNFPLEFEVPVDPHVFTTAQKLQQDAGFCLLRDHLLRLSSPIPIPLRAQDWLTDEKAPSLK